MQLLRFTLIEALHTAVMLLNIPALANPRAVSISTLLATLRGTSLASLSARVHPPIAALSQLGADGASAQLLLPQPPGVNLIRLQEAALRDALNLFAVAGATPASRAVALSVLTHLYELCTLLHYLARTIAA